MDDEEKETKSVPPEPEGPEITYLYETFTRKPPKSDENNNSQQ